MGKSDPKSDAFKDADAKHQKTAENSNDDKTEKQASEAKD